MLNVAMLSVMAPFNYFVGDEEKKVLTRRHQETRSLNPRLPRAYRQRRRSLNRATRRNTCRNSHHNNSRNRNSRNSLSRNSRSSCSSCRNK